MKSRRHWKHRSPKGPRPKRGWQPHLPLFSSDDFEPPRTGENPSANNNGNNAQTQITTARNEGITTPQTPQDAPRRSFTIIQKCKVLETCLSIKDEYLSMPPAFHHDQEPFWSKILNEKLSPDLVFKFKVWKDIKESVEHWCYARRTLLREGNLPPVSPAQPELDTLIDQWNTVFVTRFCQVHRGYFENGLWAMNENRVNLSNNQPKRPRLDSGISSDVSPRIGSREEASRPQQRQLSPLRRPPASRTPGRPSSPPTQERQSRPAGSFPRGHDSQYPDKWVGDGEPHRPCQPRGFREDTVEFDNMSTRRQNQLIRTQNRTLLEKLEELGPRSERGPRNNHDSYHRP
ncbi:hypothetical protein DER44DRAFT_839761 [Fusarium oxysporum]|nr:hypothetical protein DER44DRAFT_839761 [Fusarium oxysporum]